MPEYGEFEMVNGAVANRLQAENDRLRDEIRRSLARFYEPSDVAQFMNGVQPNTSDGVDIPWIKTLRERSYCTLREAKHAHDICAALTSPQSDKDSSNE